MVNCGKRTGGLRKMWWDWEKHGFEKKQGGFRENRVDLGENCVLKKMCWIWKNCGGFGDNGGFRKNVVGLRKIKVDLGQM